MSLLTPGGLPISWDSFLDKLWPGLFPVSERSCELFGTDYPFSETDVKRGLCSERTKELLTEQENCIRPLWNQKTSIFNTANGLIRSILNTVPAQ